MDREKESKKVHDGLALKITFAPKFTFVCQMLVPNVVSKFMSARMKLHFAPHEVVCQSSYSSFILYFGSKLQSLLENLCKDEQLKVRLMT